MNDFHLLNEMGLNLGHLWYQIGTKPHNNLNHHLLETHCNDFGQDEKVQEVWGILGNLLILKVLFSFQ